jgi:hypothetical protein
MTFQVQNVIAEGKIGKVLSVHFEWLLNTVHGADVSLVTILLSCTIADHCAFDSVSLPCVYFLCVPFTDHDRSPVPLRSRLQGTPRFFGKRARD